MTPALEGWPTNAKEAPSPHEVRLAPLNTNTVFQSLKEKVLVLDVQSVGVGFYIQNKLVSTTFLLVCLLSLNKSTSQTRKKKFFFTLKALFVLNKIKF